ncbi:type II toxin-antitoxin system VapC family toxin [Rhizobium herbae]|uniref:Ribonuclease VapC n=1 Tax=Rhizobium herbae TaxID=508661 RepID=A0ABS4EL16_9HYPH|nr:PIN domain-containing protein [Rhizobium herbae]MBP1858646.1 putative nucleic acid-binding protein [Rhizobium herbae]
MVLVDTSVWIEHFRHGTEMLVDLLMQNKVLCHPFIVGELAVGGVKDRHVILRRLQRLPHVVPARDAEVLELIERQKLVGSGIGYVDAHLLTSLRLTAGGQLWTRDRRLHAAAVAAGVAVTIAMH